MQRIVLGPGMQVGTLLTVPEEIAHYLRDVMRMSSGSRIWVSDGLGGEGQAILQSVERDHVTIQLENWALSSREPQVLVTVAQGLPKGDKMEWVIQKCTELGASSFWPLACTRSVVVIEPKKEARKLERWAKIAQEAAEQAHRAVVPDIANPRSVKAAIAQFDQFDLVLIAAEALGHQGEVADHGVRAVLSKWRKQQATTNPPNEYRAIRILVLVGPEGGWTEQEVLWMNDAGARSISLGKRILRTETAAMVAISAIFYEFGEFGGS